VDRARFAVLQQQMQPHFLFNALGSLKELIALDPARAEEATQRIADMYRLLLLISKRATTPLEEELDLVENYLEIERIRFGDRLTFRIDAATDVASLRVPKAYVVKVRGTEKARGDVMPQFLLALDTGRVNGNVEGIDTIDPSFGMRARWVATSRRADAISRRISSLSIFVWAMASRTSRPISSVLTRFSSSRAWASSARTRAFSAGVISSHLLVWPSNVIRSSLMLRLERGLTGEAGAVA
jgi:hypothetical protein